MTKRTIARVAAALIAAVGIAACGSIPEYNTIIQYKKQSRDFALREASRHAEYAVAGRDGKVVFSRILRVGETYGITQEGNEPTYQNVRIQLGPITRVYQDDDYTILVHRER
jgi:hypothetical protein